MARLLAFNCFCTPVSLPLLICVCFVFYFISHNSKIYWSVIHNIRPSFYIVTLYTSQPGGHIDTIACIQSLDSNQASAAFSEFSLSLSLSFFFVSQDVFQKYSFLSLSHSLVLPCFSRPRPSLRVYKVALNLDPSSKFLCD